MTKWTQSKARLTPIRTQAGGNYNWLFLPGGPGLGSESLKELTEILPLPGTIWHLDLPGDGSNTITDDKDAFANWSAALIEATSILDNVILVAHSSGGMFALATPELEAKLAGLILMASAPDANFQESFAEYVKHNPLPKVGKLLADYEAKPSNNILKKLTIAQTPYISTPSSQQLLASLFATVPFNCESHLWAAKNFHPSYKAKWVPQHIPVLIFAGDKDYLTPLHLFADLPDFQRGNILIRSIPNASHFPWLENPVRVRKVFDEYVATLTGEKRF